MAERALRTVGQPLLVKRKLAPPRDGSLDSGLQQLANPRPPRVCDPRVDPLLVRVVAPPRNELRVPLALERRQAEPDAAYEREQIFAHFGNRVNAATRIDLYLRTHNGEDHYFEIKSAKPNRGQCSEMKTRLLTALAIRRQETTHTWWGVPYNPYGRGEYRWTYPLAVFDFDREVMLGAPFWDFVGGGAGTYEELLGVFREVGDEFAERLQELRQAV
jgi:hypothetical protein